MGKQSSFCGEGLTSEGKPLKDYLEAKNHAEAIDGLYEIVQGERNLSESLVKELHGVLMKGIEFTYAKGPSGQIIQKTFHAGQCKLQPNHVLTISGKIHHYAEPLMELACRPGGMLIPEKGDGRPSGKLAVEVSTSCLKVKD